MKHTFQFARSQNISLVFSDTLYERQRRRRWSVIHRTFSSNLGEEWSTHPPAYQDSWFMRDTFTAWDKQSKRMWKVLVKENKPIHFMFGNCICWNFIQNKLSNLTKIVILQLFSLVSSQMCSLKTTCQNRFKFPYGHCFHICNLYLMETGTQCFKEEDFMSHLFICQMSNGEGKLLNVYKNLAGMMASSSSSQVWALLHHELFSFFQLNAGLLLEQLQVGKVKEGLEVRVGRHRHHLLSTSFTLLNLSECLEIFLISWLLSTIK